MKKIILLMALLSVIMLMTSCQKAEEVIVSKYFQAMAVNDRDTMATMAYEPRDVEYKAFEVLSIDEPVTNPLELPALIKKLAELERKRGEQVNKVMNMTDERDDLEYEMEETRRSSRKAELKKKIEELNVQVEEETEKVKSLQLDINQAKKEIDREKELITLSTGFRENLEMFSGNTLTNKVTVKVTLENDEVQNYIFLLRMDTLKLEEKEQPGRLIVVKFMTTEEYEKELKEKEAVTEEVEEVSEAETETATEEE